MKELKFSIIIPSYNQGQFLERTILSILNQSYGNFELIIIDGGSSDRTIDILRKYNTEITYWRSEKDNGQSHAFNKGLEIASGDFIGWINSDDVYYPGTFNAVNKKLLADPRTDILFGDFNYIDEFDEIIHKKKEIRYNPAEAYWTGKCYHANLAGFFRREIFNLAGSLDTELHYAMDYELYLRLALSNFKFEHIRRPLGSYRIHSTSKTTKFYDKMLFEVNQVRKNYRDSFKCVFPSWLNCLYFTISRKIKKTVNGCYSIKNILSISNLYTKIDYFF